MYKQIIWLNGMPRSGTSWLSQIFDSCPDIKFRSMPLFSYSFKDRINKNSTKEEINEFFKEVYLSNDDFLIQKDKRKSGEYPIFKQKDKYPKNLVVKHTRYHNLTKFLLKNYEDIKFVHIVRNPCAVINSWIGIDKEFKNKGCEIKKDWRTGQCRKTGPEEFWGFNDWKHLTNYYLDLKKKFPSKLMIVCYEELVSSPVDLTRRMFSFCSLPFTKQTEMFLKDSLSHKKGGDYSVYRTSDVANRWKNSLDNCIRDEIEKDLKNTKLEKYLR